MSRDAGPPGGALPYAFAKRHGVLPLEVDAEGLRVACRTQPGSALWLELQRLYGGLLHFERLGEEAFNALLARHYDAGANGSALIVEHLDGDQALASVTAALPEPEDLLETADEAPIIRLINALFTEAIRENASDIHLECFETRLRVRFRVDGVLHEVIRPPTALGPLLVSRIKVMAGLDIAEKRIPQDGRISLRIAGRAVDVRVSTLPSGPGERVVLRLLDKQRGRLDLAACGLTPAALARLTRLIGRPHGILLVTGPTGSGKTTTLYSVLERLNDIGRNIITIEDPIEYYLEGVSQTQVNARVDMSFARGLRAILRQDPDVIMVGEIRDLETAEIAVQASLTGHLVLSTLHTNSALGAITRLRDMGVEPFLLASSLLGVLAQRLVRRLCPACRHEYRADAASCERLGVPAAAAPVLYRAVGCSACRQTGYIGRQGIFEVVEIDDTLLELIHAGAPEPALIAAARPRSASLRADGVARVLAGETSLEELLRVTQEH